MSIVPSNRRDQLFAATALIAMGLAGYYVANVWQPKRDELTERQARVDSLLVINQRAKSELAQGKTAALKAEAEKFAGDLEVMRRLVPTGNEVPALLEQVSTAARRVGLDISDVQPLPVLAGDQYDAYKYRMSVRGGYHQVGDFLGNVGSLQRIVAPINLSLAPQSVDPRARKQDRQQIVAARFEIQTYVARTAPSGPAKPTKADVVVAHPTGEKK